MNKLKKTKIAVVWRGYLGFALSFGGVEKGYKVYGLDLDKKKVARIKKGQSPSKEEFVENRKKILSKINVSTNPAILKEAEIVIVCVPTPVDEKFYPILGPLVSAVESIIKNHKPGRLVIIESTINPGICEEIVAPLFSKAGLSEGKDYFLAHCPERINPGKAAISQGYNVTNIARVVGAMSKKGLTLAQNFYESIIDAPIKPMDSIKEAEACKVVENSFRDINIAFVNELAKSFDKMGIDVKNVIDGAATKPFAFMPHYPGRGVGGHCIPVDPYYLIERAKKSGFDHKFLKIAREINNSMPAYTVEKMLSLLKELKMNIKNLNVGVLGLSYKADVDDLRESPAIKIIKELEKKKAKVIRFDPFIQSMSDAKDLNEFLKKSEVVILVTNHKMFLDVAPETFKKNSIKAIVDGMNCLDRDKIKKLGIKYHGIGRR